jgi:hypothetical protein
VGPQNKQPASTYLSKILTILPIVYRTDKTQKHQVIRKIKVFNVNKNLAYGDQMSGICMLCSGSPEAFTKKNCLGF